MEHPPNHPPAQAHPTNHQPTHPKQSGYLDRVHYSPDTEGVVTWCHDRVTHHAALSDADVSAAAVLGAGLADISVFGSSSGVYGGAGSSGSGGGRQQLPYPGHVLQRLLAEGQAVLRSGGGGSGDSSAHHHPPDFWVVIDADGSSQTPQAGTDATSSLFEAVAARWGRRVLVLVQNVHFLPLGPAGALPRSPPLLRAWSAVGGAVCPSQFVAHYLRTAGLELTQQQAAAAAAAAGFGGGDGGGGCGLLPSDRICVVSYAAWGAFGQGPFDDLGGRVAERLRLREARQRQQAEEEGGGCSSSGVDEDAPVVCMLKLNRWAAFWWVGWRGSSGLCTKTPCLETCPAAYFNSPDPTAMHPLNSPLSPPPPTKNNHPPLPPREKGSDLLFALARRLPHLRFLAVTADPQLRQQAAALGPPNVSLLPPQEDVGSALAAAAVVIAPSVWQEAFGMVVVDGLLRGLPVITSDLGGLPEAGLGAAMALPAAPMVLGGAGPVGGVGGGGGAAAAAAAAAAAEGGGEGAGGSSGAEAFACPSWSERRFPEQPEPVVAAWAAALGALLVDRGCAGLYTARSAAARAAAAALLAGRNGYLGAFKTWLDSLPNLG